MKSALQTRKVCAKCDSMSRFFLPLVCGPLNNEPSHSFFLSMITLHRLCHLINTRTNSHFLLLARECGRERKEDVFKIPRA